MRRLVSPLLVATALLAPTAATAQWLASAGGAAPLSSATVTPMTGLVLSCVSATSIRLSWGASPDAFMEGYEIVRTGTGGGTSRSVRLAREVTTFLDEQLAAANGNDQHTYTYTIQSGSLQHSWATPVVAFPGSITIAAHNKGGCRKIA